MTTTNWRHFDFWLLGAVVLLSIFGITMIRSTITGNIDLADHANRQMIFAMIGFVALFIFSAIDYRFWASLSWPIYIGTVIVLILLNVVASALFGSARWFQVGLILIQPSELAKLVMILFMADFFARNQEKIGSIFWVGRSLIYALGIAVWVYLQPNLSTTIVLIVTWFSLLWISGLKLRHMVIFGLIGVTLPFAIYPLLEEYQQKRILNFIAPDPNATYGDTYNIEQALISIGSGGLFGQGYNQGSQVQLRFLKVRWSDYIFSSMAQEFGFIGTVVVILLMLFIIYRCLRAARLASDTYGGLIAYGVATVIAFQAMVNIGVNLKLLPATGLPLPFISYGGSSLLSLLISIGLVESVILRHKSLEF